MDICFSLWAVIQYYHYYFLTLISGRRDTYLTPHVQMEKKGEPIGSFHLLMRPPCFLFLTSPFPLN